MRVNKIFLLTLLLILTGRSYADNLSVEKVVLNPGETKQIALNLNNTEQKYVAFQFDLVLPEGVTIALNEKGKLIASLNGDRIDDHTLNVSNVGANTYRFMSFSMGNAEFYGTSGSIVNVTLKADDNVSAGDKKGSIKSQVFTVSNGDQFKWSDTSIDLEIKSTLSPDAPKCATPTITMENGKLQFTCDTEGVKFHPQVTLKTDDSSTLSLYATYTFSVYASKDGYQDSDVVTKDIDMSVGKKGDVNGDGKVSITDAVTVVNIILNGGAEVTE